MFWMNNKKVTVEGVGWINPPSPSPPPPPRAARPPKSPGQIGLSQISSKRSATFKFVKSVHVTFSSLPISLFAYIVIFNCPLILHSVFVYNALVRFCFVHLLPFMLCIVFFCFTFPLWLFSKLYFTNFICLSVGLSLNCLSLTRAV